MSSFLNLLASERLKLGKSSLWLLVPISPIVALLIGMLVTIELGDVGYQGLFAAMATIHAMLLLPIFTGIFAAFICRYEHAGGWKLMLCLPVSRTGLFLAKFTAAALLLAVTQLCFLAAVLAAAAYHGLDEAIPWSMLLRGIAGGWVACLPLVAAQLLVSIVWTSFAAPLAVNVMLTIPNILILNSEKIAPYYPWAQPMLAMMPAGSGEYGGFLIPYESLMITVLGSFAAFLAAGLIYMNRKEI